MRFYLQRTESGWGVWDSGTNGLRTVRNERVDAERMAFEMNLAYNQYGYRANVDRRLPLQPVPVQRWTQAGELIAWVRERGVWYGAVRSEAGEISWISAAELRRKPGPSG